MQIAGNTFELLTFYKIKSNDIMMLIKGILQTITYFSIKHLIMNYASRDMMEAITTNHDHTKLASLAHLTVKQLI